jgi:glycosyltransferase involved in cell wall biosynthesis
MRPEKEIRLSRRIPTIMFLAKTFQTDTRPMQEAKTLHEQGYPVFVLAWDRDSKFGAVEDVGGVIVRSFSYRPQKAIDLALGAVFFQLLLILEGLRLINRLKQRPIVHCHDFNTLLSGCFLRTLHLSSSLVYDCHELSYSAYSDMFNHFLGAIVSTIERKCLKYADAVIIVSESQNYLRDFNVTTEIVRNSPATSSIPKLTKREARAQVGLPLDAFIISHVGRIRYDCGLDLLLDVASLLKNEDIQFVVVGGGPLAPEFWKRAQQAVDLRLTLRPQVTRDAALLYVLASDITWVVYQFSSRSPNTRGGMPWKFFESLACGVPVIVEQDTLRAQLVRALGCGIVLDDDDPHHAAEAIAALVRDPRQLHSMSVAARKAGVSEFSWEAASRNLVDIYVRLHTAVAKTPRGPCAGAYQTVSIE